MSGETRVRWAHGYVIRIGELFGDWRFVISNEHRGQVVHAGSASTEEEAIDQAKQWAAERPLEDARLELGTED